MASCPNVKLVLQERTAYSLIKGLETQQIDIGLMHWSALNHQDIGLCVEPIKEECFSPGFTVKPSLGCSDRNFLTISC